MANGPGYTVNDLAFWGGLIAGLSGTHVLLMNLPAYRDVLAQMGLLDWARIITLVISLVVGVSLGAAAERTLRSYQHAKKNRPRPDDHDGRPWDEHGEPRR